MAGVDDGEGAARATPSMRRRMFAKRKESSWMSWGSSSFGSLSPRITGSFTSGQKILRDLGVSAAVDSDGEGFSEGRYTALATIVCNPPTCEGAGGKGSKGGKGGPTPAATVGAGEQVSCPSTFDYLCREIEALGMVAVPTPGVNCPKQFIKVEASFPALQRGAETLGLVKETEAGYFEEFKWRNRERFLNNQDTERFFSVAEKHKIVLFMLKKIGSSQLDQPAALRRRDGSRLGIRTASDGVEPTLLEDLQRAGEVETWFPLHNEVWRRECAEAWKHAMDLRYSVAKVTSAMYRYFDARQALYFGWLTFYTRWLLLPSAVGVLTWAYECLVNPHVRFRERFWLIRHGHSAFFACATVVWAALLMGFWERTNANLVCSWGLSRHAPSPGEGHAYYKANEWRERLRVLRNNGIAFGVMMLINLPIMGAFCFVEDAIRRWSGSNPGWESQGVRYLNTAVYTMVIQLSNMGSTRMALWMNQQEGHVGPADEEDSLIVKMFGFHAINVYISAFYFAFWKFDLATLRSHLRQRLVMSQVIGNVMENLVPIAKFRMNEYKLRHGQKIKGTSIAYLDPAERQYYKTPYVSNLVSSGCTDGVFDDYLEMVVQLGFILLFAPAFPLAGLLAVLNNVVEIQSDAWRLLRMHRCPEPIEARTIGAWSTVIRNISTLAVFTNCALLLLMARHDGAAQGREWSLPDFIPLAALEHGMLLATVLVRAAVPGVPRKVQEVERMWTTNRRDFKRNHSDPARQKSRWSWAPPTAPRPPGGGTPPPHEGGGGGAGPGGWGGEGAGAMGEEVVAESRGAGPEGAERGE